METEHVELQAPPVALPMQASASIVNIATALAQAQGGFPTIPRDRLVRVTMKSGGSYTFRYAPLETILEKTRPHLAKAGLALVQAIVAEPVDGGGVVEMLRTTLVHSSGEWLACDVPIFHGTGDNKSQAYASGVTYSRRYGVTLLLCVAADEDDDGNGGDQDGAHPDYERQQQPQRYQGSFPRQGGGRSQPRGQQGRQDGPRQPQRRQDRQQAPDQGQDQGRRQQQRQAPAQAQREPLAVDYGGEDDAPFRDDPVPSFGLKQFEDQAVDTATGEVVSPWGSDLTAGELKMAKMRAQVAGLDEAGVLKLVGAQVTQANVADALAKLKAAADKALD